VGISQASVVNDDRKLAERVEFIHRQTNSHAIAEQYIEGMVGPGPLVLVALAVSRLTPCGNVSHAILTMKRDSLYLYIIPIACVVLLLVFTLRLYTFAYFWNDDFNNLY